MNTFKPPFGYTPYDISDTLQQIEEEYNNGLYLTWRTCLDDNNNVIVIVYSQDEPPQSFA